MGRPDHGHRPALRGRPRRGPQGGPAHARPPASARCASPTGLRRYLMRVLPYRRMDNVIDGLVRRPSSTLTQLDRALEQQARLAAHRGVLAGRDRGPHPGRHHHHLERRPPSEMFGYAAQEALGQLASRLIVPAEGMARDGAGRTSGCGGASPSRPSSPCGTTKDGQPTQRVVAVSPIKDAHGRLTGASAIFRDISELKQAQQAAGGRRGEGRVPGAAQPRAAQPAGARCAPASRSCAARRPEPRSGALAARCMDRQLTQLTTLVDQLLDARASPAARSCWTRRTLDLAEARPRRPRGPPAPDRGRAAAAEAASCPSARSG